MRRLQLEASLMVLWLLGSGVFGYASDSSKAAQNANGTAQSETKKDKVFSTWIPGWGATREDAEQDARRRARGEVLKFLADQGIVLSWELPADLSWKLYPESTKEHSLVKEWATEQEPKEMQGIGLVHEVRLRVELAPKDYREVLRQDRQYVAQNRMFLLGKVLAGLVALLAAVAGYFRLEDATKGYYTAWLRLAALGFVTAVGAGLWLIS